MKITSAIKRISVGIALVEGLAACKKSTDLILSPDQLAVGSYLIEDSQGNDTLFLNSQSTPVVFSVHAYGEQVDKVTVYVSTNNSIDKTTWKKVKEFPVDATQKVTLSVTPAQIAAALGTPIPNGAAYTLYNEATTKSGATYSLANMIAGETPRVSCDYCGDLLLLPATKLGELESSARSSRASPKL